MSTDRSTICGGPAGAGGYRRLMAGAGEVHRHRTELAAAPAEVGEVLLGVAHLSDLHVCDAQSPARLEWLSRWADPDSPLYETIGEVGTYRAQEMLTAQVVEATVRAVNAVRSGPVGGLPLDLAISTGDNTDNAQANELRWYLSLLEGGVVTPDSGDPTRYEGIADVPDERYWHPDATSADLPRSRYGYPVVPGLLKAARRGFVATGLDLPWLAVHGNHDQLIQGTWRDVDGSGAAAVAATKVVGFDVAPDDALALLRQLAGHDPSALADLPASHTTTVTADPARRVVAREEFVAAHFSPAARPPGHGFSADRRAYYRHDHGAQVSVLVLDTVNEHGGWDGSLDAEQLAWLDAELDAADAARRYVILASHHPRATLVNDRVVGSAGPRVLGPDLDAVLAGHPSLILWLNGHTHATAVTPHGSWWEVTAPSLIDWPQQARIVEVLRGEKTLTIAATMLDHAGQLPWAGATADPCMLAGLSRELAANDWQWRDEPLEQHVRSGAADARNVLLFLPDPWPG